MNPKNQYILIFQIKSNGSHLLHLTTNLRASMRSKLSHASHLLLYGEESRAAKVTVFVLAALVFCWFPYFGVIFVQLIMDNILPKWINLLALTCALSNIAISPILYAYRSKRIIRYVHII